MKYLLMKKLKNLIGLKIVKEQIDNIIAADIVRKKNGRRRKRKRLSEQCDAYDFWSVIREVPKLTVAKLICQELQKKKGHIKK